MQELAAELQQVRLPAQRERHARIPRSRRLELWRRGVTAHSVEPLDVHLRQAAHDRGIAWNVWNAEIGRGVLAEKRRIGVVVPAREAKAEITDERRAGDPGQSEREPLRPIQIRSKRIVEGPFGQTGKRRRPERIRVHEAVTAEEVHALRKLMIDAHVELVLSYLGDGRGRVNSGTRHVWIGNQRHDLGGDRIPPFTGDHPLPRRISRELRPAGRKRIVDRRPELSGLLGGRRYQTRARNAFLVAQPFVISEPERPVANDRPSDCAAKLIAFALRLGRIQQFGKVVIGIERVIPEKFEDAAVHLVGTRLDGRVHDRARTAAVLRRVRVGLDLELLQRFDRRLDELNVFTAEGIRIRDVVDPIEQKDVVERAVAVDVQHAFEIHARQPRCAWKDARGEQRELVVVATVQRQIENLSFVDHQASRRCLRFQHRCGAGHLDRFLDAAGLQARVELQHLRHLQDQPGPDEFAEPRGFDHEHVLAGSEARHVVESAIVGLGRGGDPGCRIGHRDHGVGNHSARGIRHFPHQSRGILLGTKGHGPGKRDRENQERKQKRVHDDTPRGHSLVAACKSGVTTG